MLNQCSFIGHLGRDPELRNTASGTPVATVSIATTEKWRDKQGAKQERTEWIDCTFWGKLAEIVAQYLVKGSLVFVQGRHERQSWDDKETGDKRYRVHYVISNMKMLGGSKGGGGKMAGAGEHVDDNAFEGAETSYGGPDIDDDIPF